MKPGASVLLRAGVALWLEIALRTYRQAHLAICLPLFINQVVSEFVAVRFRRFSKCATEGFAPASGRRTSVCDTTAMISALANASKYGRPSVLPVSVSCIRVDRHFYCPPQVDGPGALFVTIRLRQLRLQKRRLNQPNHRSFDTSVCLAESLSRSPFCSRSPLWSRSAFCSRSLILSMSALWSRSAFCSRSLILSISALLSRSAFCSRSTKDTLLCHPGGKPFPLSALDSSPGGRPFTNPFFFLGRSPSFSS